jgi:hypothetical protein
MVDKDERRKVKDKMLNWPATTRDFLAFSKESTNKKSMQCKLKGKDPVVVEIEYISTLEDHNNTEWFNFNHNRNSAFILIN